MLKIYENLFAQLNEEDMKYCIYKGLDHLEEDLNGDRGDIDILIDSDDFIKFVSILKQNNIFLSFKSMKPYYFVGIDELTHKFILIDMNTNIQLGPKPYKPFYIDIDFSLLKIKTKESIRVLAKEDYIPLMFLMRSFSLIEKMRDLDELKNYVTTKSISHGYIKNRVEEITQHNWIDISDKIIHSKNWNQINNDFSSIIKINVNKSNLLSFKQKFKYIFGRFNSIKMKLSIPPYRIRNKGYLVAFIGVDGAGKSSTVDYIKNLDYFKYTGIKRVYFGNNEYWIPGLLTLLQKQYENKYLKLIISTLALIDRKFRIYIARYYIMMGNIVIADRYYYDNIIGQNLQKGLQKNENVLKKMYKKIFQVNNIIQKPDLTIFLDVSPNIAYQRKQDYSYEKMLEVNKAYKEYMYNVDGVKIINADKSQKEIYKNVIEAIVKLDNTEC